MKEKNVYNFNIDSILFKLPIKALSRRVNYNKIIKKNLVKSLIILGHSLVTGK